MAKYSFLTRRSGSQNWYYKRDVPLELRAPGRRKQVWKSLRTPDRRSAEKVYAATHAEIELRFDQWRREDNLPIAPAGTPTDPSASNPTAAPLTPALLRKIADSHYLSIYENDFDWRSDLWRRTRDNEEAFWSGDLIKHPANDWQQRNGQSYSYYALLMEEPVLEEVFLYCVYFARKERLQKLRRYYDLGDICGIEESAAALLSSQQLSLSDADRNRLLRKLLQTEIKALEDMTAGNEATFDGIVSQDVAVDVKERKPKASPAEIASVLAEKYIDTMARERDWPPKTTLRKRAEIREFLEICGDRPINSYGQEDGVKFKDVQSALPVYRQKAPFKKLSLTEAAEKATELRNKGQDVELLSPLTINDKIGSVSLLFEWAKTRTADVVNPVSDQSIQRRKNRRQGKKVHPWTIEELNRMFAAPIYIGCQSETHWKQPGQSVLRRSAKFWVPLIGLFSGMRLGEIIQLQITDVKEKDGIHYFDVTPIGIDPSDEEAVDTHEEKSLKTSSSQRAIPIHKMLFDLGFEDFLEFRRASGSTRLFPEYEKAKDDGSWSKQFSKYFKRFRESIGVSRRGVRFHSLRHNVEDALRNAHILKEVRDAIQGHGENGVSREYGSGYYLATLNEALQKIAYDGVSFPPAQNIANYAAPTNATL
ncbi:site-specific integrase [Hyphomicrobium sp.]|uniref:site-specific integrase n=1 Tax=Hyphomicrobium sp. TaxID=82 RepID=UPI0025BDAF4C|nr:site-specific integrase [Hyphomicrobium sp.]